MEASPMMPFGAVVRRVDCPWLSLHGELGLALICTMGSGTTKFARVKAAEGSMTEGPEGDAIHVGVQLPTGTICTILGSTNAAAGSISLPPGDVATTLKLALLARHGTLCWLVSSAQGVLAPTAAALASSRRRRRRLALRELFDGDLGEALGDS